MEPLFPVFGQQVANKLHIIVVDNAMYVGLFNAFNTTRQALPNEIEVSKTGSFLLLLNSGLLSDLVMLSVGKNRKT